MSIINYASNIPVLPANFEKKLHDTLVSAGIPSITVTSTYRTPSRQAAAMYDNLLSQGVAAERKLYGPAGNKVIDTFELKKNYKYGQSDILKAMTDTIYTVGPSNVSAHCTADPDNHVAYDILPSSIPADKKDVFISAMKSITSKLLIPGITTGEPVFHAEMNKSNLGLAVALVALTSIVLAGIVIAKHHDVI
jgi:hypothetical protein